MLLSEHCAVTSSLNPAAEEDEAGGKSNSRGVSHPVVTSSCPVSSSTTHRLPPVPAGPMLLASLASTPHICFMNALFWSFFFSWWVQNRLCGGTLFLLPCQTSMSQYYYNLSRGSSSFPVSHLSCLSTSRIIINPKLVSFVSAGPKWLRLGGDGWGSHLLLLSHHPGLPWLPSGETCSSKIFNPLQKASLPL